MKKLLVLIILASCNAHEIKVEDSPAGVENEVSQTSNSNVSFNTESHKPPKYKVLRTNTTYSQYDVLISSINLEKMDYKEDVMGVVDDLAQKAGSVDFVVWIYDNPTAAQLNYQDLEIGKTLSSAENDLVNKHIVAIYSKNSDDVYRISYFENIPEDERTGHIAWKNAFNEDEFNSGYRPIIK